FRRVLFRSVQLRGGGGTAVTAEPLSAGSSGDTGDGGQDPVGRHLSNHHVAGVGDEHVAGRIDRDCLRVVQLGGGGGTAVAAEPASAGTGDGGDDPVGRHLPNPIVKCVGDEKVTGCIGRHSCWEVQLGGRGWAAVTADTLAARGVHHGGDEITASGLSGRQRRRNGDEDGEAHNA